MPIPCCPVTSWGWRAPVSKWAHEVRTLRELGTIMRRAFHDAVSAPAGPVFVSLPMSTLDEEGDAPVPPPSTIVRRAVATDLDELADLLTEPAIGKLAIVAGDDAETSGARPGPRRGGRGPRRPRLRGAAPRGPQCSRRSTRSSPAC